MPSPPITILDLPDDLLAHVLRFATGSARRDNHRPSPVALSDWHYAAVCTAFRRAFLKNVSALALDTPSATRLAMLDWKPLLPCSSLRRISIGADADLTDHHLARLFNILLHRGIYLRHAHLTLDHHVTQATLLNLTQRFGPHITHLELRVPFYKRLRRRSLLEPHVVYHGLQSSPHGPLHPSAPNLPAEHPAPIPPAPHPPLEVLANVALQQMNAQHPPNPDLGPQGPVLLNHHQQPHPHPQQPIPDADNPPVIHVFEGVPALNAQQGLANLDQVMAAPPPPQQHPVPNAVIAQVVPVQNVPDEIEQHAQHVAVIMEAEAEAEADMEDEHNQFMQIFDNSLPNLIHAAQAAHAALAEQQPPGEEPNAFEPVEANGPNPVMPLPVVIHQPNPMQLHAAEVASAARLNSYVPLSDDVLAKSLTKMPMLQELHIERGRHIMNTGIMALANCRHLQSLTLSGCPAAKNSAFRSVLSSLTKLRVLRLSDMPQIGNSTVTALCTGPARFTLQVLRLSKIGRITDPAVRQLVNTCDSLESVHLSDCSGITCEAASHLSCSLRLKDIYFKPQAECPLTNRTSIHFSCASSTLRSLKLVGCSNLNLDGIVALGNLPGLRTLHMRGLKYISQDVMRQLGMFPKLNDLVLEGMMYLTDLGVKVLCGQRGHRFLHLSLLDSTKNLTDEALDCIMIWCGSLRSLEVHGYFKPGAIDRLHEAIPSASLAVISSSNGVQMMPGQGGVWDPPISVL